MIVKAIKKICEKKDLSFEEAVELIDIFSTGRATQGQIGAFLTAIAIKGTSAEEMTGFVTRIREKALRIELDVENLVDSSGTGGDFANTFNISTAAAIVTASSGLCVAKHSNSSITSQCGSSNLIEALGIGLVRTPEAAINQVKKNNITFIHSPFFNKATACVNSVRKEIGIRTVFNFIGPLVNPSFPTGQVLGVSSPVMAPIMAEVLNNLGLKKALVVHGADPLIDEINICGETKIYKIENGNIDCFSIFPEDFGIKRAKIEDLKGSTPDENANLIREIFEGKVNGPCLDAVLINSAAMLWVGNQVKNLEEGYKMASGLIESGRTFKKLNDLILDI